VQLLAPTSSVLGGTPAAAGPYIALTFHPSSMAADRISLTGNAQAPVNMGEGRGRELAGNGMRMSPWSPCVHASTP